MGSKITLQLIGGSTYMRVHMEHIFLYKSKKCKNNINVNIFHF
jgi:hypothetical protein